MRLAKQFVTPRTLATVLAVGTAGVAAAPALAGKALSRNRVDSPKYEVISQHDGFEVRRYASRLVAEVQVEGNGRDATSAGFRLLADFIFGNNTAQEKVAMTSPVERRSEKIAMTAPVDRKQDGGQWTITFTMPPQYTVETLPTPNNERVHIHQRPPKRYAVQKFSGSPSERAVQKKMAELAQRVAEAGFETTGDSPTYSRYDPPWTPFFLRRNEIMIELTPELDSQ